MGERIQFEKVMLKIFRIDERHPYTNRRVRIYTYSFNKSKFMQILKLQKERTT